LFNPDRATNRHVLPSFKKVPVFFLSLGYVAIKKKDREKEGERRRKKEELS